MAYQPAFEPAQVGYLDFETRSSTLDLRQVGAYRYATEAEAIVLSYAIGPDAEAETFAVYDFKSGPLTWARSAGCREGASRPRDGRRGDMGGLERRL